MGRKAQRGESFSTPSLLWRTIVVGALVSPIVMILTIPSSLFSGDKPNTTAQAIIFSVEIALFAAVSIPVLVRQWLRTRRGEVTGAELPNGFVRIVGPWYLGVLALLWLSALPAYFGAVNGFTSDGTPNGSLLYAAVCFAFGTAAICSVALAPSVSRAAAPVPQDVGQA